MIESRGDRAINRWHSVLLGLSLSLLYAAPAFAIDPSAVMDGLREKGFDKLKDKAKDAGEEWVFGTGQSETMQSIIDAAKDAATEGIYGDNACRGLVRSQASTVLSDLQLKNTAKNVGRTAFDTLAKLGGLAAGGLGAAAEGGGLAWLGKQYADAAAGTAKDSVMDAIRKAFGKDKVAEFELFEQSGTVGSGPCTYTLRAVWDIAGGSYYVYIFGDCGCSTAQSVSGSDTLGKWWVSIYGSMRLVVDQTAKTAKFVPITPPELDWDGQCRCSKKELRRPVFKKVVKTDTSTTGTTGGGATDGGTGGTTTPPPPPPIPPKGKKVCQECQGIQDQIDADTDALAAANSDLNDAANDLQGAQARLGSHQGLLDAIKASPKDYDISPAKMQAKIDADNADIAAAKAKGAKASAEVARLEKELRDLGVKLDACVKKCGHASMHKEMKHSLIKFGLEKAFDKHHKTDSQDEEEQRRREEEEQNVKQSDDPFH